MSYAILYDTGYATAAMDGTQAPATSRAGVDGAETTVYQFPLMIQTETMNGGGSMQTDNEIRNSDELSSVSPVTFSNPKFVLNCSIPVEAIDNTDYLYGWLYQLIRMERTKGVKVIAFKSTNTNDFNGTCTEDTLNKTTLRDDNGLYVDDELIGKYIYFTSGANKGLEREITDNNSTDIVWADEVISNIETGDSYVIYTKPYDYSYNRQPTLPELYGMRYLMEPSKGIVSDVTGHTEGTVPHLVGYIKSISNITYSNSDNMLRFAITFVTIEDLS